MIYITGGIVVLLILYTLIQQPRCPKCGSKDIGLFTFHTKKVFTCHACGCKKDECDLES